MFAGAFFRIGFSPLRKRKSERDSRIAHMIVYICTPPAYTTFPYFFCSRVRWYIYSFSNDWCASYRSREYSLFFGLYYYFILKSAREESIKTSALKGSCRIFAGLQLSVRNLRATALLVLSKSDLFASEREKLMPGVLWARGRNILPSSVYIPTSSRCYIRVWEREREERELIFFAPEPPSITDIRIPPRVCAVCSAAQTRRQTSNWTSARALNNFPIDFLFV